MCLYPKLIKNKKYISNKKNGGVIPAVSDNRLTIVSVGCGNCMVCRKQKADAWKIRLYEEVKHDKNGIFVTLTFNNESLYKLKEEKKEFKGYELENQIAKLGVRRFLERWRKKYKKSIKHFLITELGHNGTERIHLHGIIWSDMKNAREEIQKMWGYGYVWTNDKNNGYINEKTINYISKYITKTDVQHKNYRSIVLCSPGIGKNYIYTNRAKLNKYNKEETKEWYVTSKGYKKNLPIYYRNYIYNEEEREKLWIEKLNKGIRFIMGYKVNENDEIQMNKIYEVCRTKNEFLGYGTDKINWNEYIYELERRKLLQYTNNKKKLDKILRQ